MTENADEESSAPKTTINQQNAPPDPNKLLQMVHERMLDTPIFARNHTNLRFYGKRAKLCCGRSKNMRRVGFIFGPSVDRPFFCVIMMIFLFLSLGTHAVLRADTELNGVLAFVHALISLLILICTFRVSCADPGVIYPNQSREERHRKASTFTNARLATKSYLPNKLVRLWDPGKLNSFDITTKSTFDLKYCYSCNIYRPPKSHHCRKCNACVDGFDHHCIWLGTCIGANNRIQFFHLLIGNALWLTMTAALSTATMVKKLNWNHPITNGIRNAWYAALAMCLLGLLLILVPSIMYCIWNLRSGGGIHICFSHRSKNSQPVRLGKRFFALGVLTFISVLFVYCNGGGLDILLPLFIFTLSLPLTCLAWVFLTVQGRLLGNRTTTKDSVNYGFAGAIARGVTATAAVREDEKSLVRKKADDDDHDEEEEIGDSVRIREGRNGDDGDEEEEDTKFSPPEKLAVQKKQPAVVKFARECRIFCHFVFGGGRKDLQWTPRVDWNLKVRDLPPFIAPEDLTGYERFLPELYEIDMVEVIDLEI